MQYNIVCSIRENSNIKNIRSKEIKTIKIPYLEYAEFADIYANGPDYIKVQLSNPIVEDIELEKIFEYQLETSEIQDVWQIYAESYDFHRCVIRHAIWDKKTDREAYLNKTHELHENIHSNGFDGPPPDRTFHVTFYGDTVLSSEVQRLRELWIELNARIEITETVEKPDQLEFTEKAIFVRKKDDCNFCFLWHYPIYIPLWETCIDHIVRELKCLWENELPHDGNIDLIYAKRDYDFLGMNGHSV